MATHKQAKKRNRQIIKRTVHARSIRTRTRAVVKLARAAVDEGGDNAVALVAQATALLDRAGSKNVIPKKRTARLVSRLNHALHLSQNKSD
jgi:small subunit ribosomal protein S20